MNTHTPRFEPSENSEKPKEGYIVPDLVYSVCAASDLEVWTLTSKYLLKNVPSKNYLLIVPDGEVSLFKQVTDRMINIIPESVYVPGLKDRLIEKMLPNTTGRLGWYLQQFIKLAVLYEARPHENFLIWDADTVPIKTIYFFRETGEVEFYTGTEAHNPYFDLTQKLLGFGKTASFSFIAQCLPYKGTWANQFFKFIQDKFSVSYEKSLLDLINFNEESGFSEYETLGSFVYSKHPQQIKVKQTSWLRNGNALIGSPENIWREPYKQLITKYDHVTFEKWEVPFSILNQQNVQFKKQFLSIESSSLPSCETFLNDLFRSPKLRTVVQIGANDGVQNDPLRKYITTSSHIQITLIQPLQYYVQKLKTLYQDREDITVVECGAGSSDHTRELFFIPPELADEMNGEGPKNDWAHGQGSFDKNIIIHWIKENAFRGQRYVDRSEYYIQSIASTCINIIKTDSLLERSRFGMLVVIDVQGFEAEVLEGIDWKNPPQWIVIEDDLGSSFDHILYFHRRGYRWIAGDHDKVFSRTS